MTAGGTAEIADLRHQQTKVSIYVDNVYHSKKSTEVQALGANIWVCAWSRERAKAVARSRGFVKAHALTTESIRKTAKQKTETRTAVVAERL